MASCYGWTNEYIEALPSDVFHEYLLAVELVESREMLRGFSVADWPNMKKNDRAKLLKSVNDKAYPSHLRPKRKFDNAELAKLLKGSKADG